MGDFADARRHLQAVTGEHTCDGDAVTAAGIDMAKRVLAGEALDDVTRRRVERSRRETEAAEQRAFREMVIGRRVASANLPHRLAVESAWDFAGMPTGYAEAALGWCQRDEVSGFMGLQGPRGCGKSSLAILCLKECAKRREMNRLMYARCCDMLARLAGARDEERARRNAEAAGRPLSSERVDPRLWWDADLLVIDDLASERSPAPWALDSMCDLIDARWQSGAATIITTNPGEESRLKELYGLRIYSRLMDRNANVALVWPTTATDWRGVSEQ